MVETDYTDYDDLSVDDLDARLDADATAMNERVIDRLVAYEENHKNRKTALEALDHARDDTVAAGGRMPGDFDGPMFPDGDARAAPVPDGEADTTDTDSEAATPPAKLVADRLQRDDFDPEDDLYPEGRVPQPDDQPLVTVRLAQSQGVGGGGVAGLWFDTDSETKTVPRSKRVNDAIVAGDLAVVGHADDLDSKPSASGSRRRRRE